MRQKTIFLRIAWMNAYQGVRNDSPIGAGWWVTEHNDGGEVANYYGVAGRYYGYAEIQNNRSLRIERLGADKLAVQIDNVMVVFFARNPVTGGQFIVGWYKDATLFRERQTLPENSRLNHPYYFCTTLKKHACLIPTGERSFSVPTDGPGQTNAWYIEEYHNPIYLQEVWQYINGGTVPARPKKGKEQWKIDYEANKRVELAAMEAVANYFVQRDYDISYVHKENLGWDMEAVLNAKILRLEVKGLSKEFNSVELTPNEYSRSKSDSASYRICVVSNALNPDKRKVEIFAFRKAINAWIDETGQVLKKKEIISAKFIR